MKKTALSILACVLAIFSLHAQKTMTICHSSLSEDYALLMRSEDFIGKHDTPLPYTYRGKGEFITFATADGKNGRGFLIKNPKPTNNYIFVFQEWWGLNDYIKKQSEKLYDDLGNVNILAIDLYDGQVTSDRDSAKVLVTSFKPERGKAIIQGAIDYAGKKAIIGTIGWCFGGAWSLQAAILAGQKSPACVMYYGMPEKDVNQLKKLQAEVLGIFATRDNSITADVVKEFEENLKNEGKKITIKKYDAVHAFANPSNPNYDKQASMDAWKHAVAFFKRTLK